MRTFMLTLNHFISFYKKKLIRPSKCLFGSWIWKGQINENREENFFLCLVNKKNDEKNRKENKISCLYKALLFFTQRGNAPFELYLIHKE